MPRTAAGGAGGGGAGCCSWAAPGKTTPEIDVLREARAGEIERDRELREARTGEIERDRELREARAGGNATL